MNEKINLLLPEIQANPYPAYAELRRAGPVQIEPGGVWAIARHEDATFVLKNPEIFSVASFAPLFKPDWLPHNPLGDTLLTMDGPPHAKLRALVSRAFTPRATERLEPRIRAIAADLSERLTTRAEVDFVAEYTVPLPARAIAEILGVNPALHHEFKQWTAILAAIPAAPPTEAFCAAARKTVADMEGYLKEIVVARRLAPTDDLVSELVRAEVDGQILTDAEIIAALFLLLAAGFETTSHLLAHMMFVFLDRPEEFARLRSDRALIPAFVDELLRFGSPAHGVMRMTTAEVEVGGTKLPKGSVVYVLLGSANHDEARFPEPDRIDTTRGSQGGMAFGYGAHYCIGAPLGRLEARVALEELTARFRGFERLPGKIAWNVALHVRGPLTLPIRPLVA